MKRIYFLASLLLLLLGFISCNDAGKTRQTPAPKVTASKPTVKNVTEYLYFTGNTQSPQSVEFVARVSGDLTKVNFVDNAYVKAGDLLFEIEPDTYEAKLKLAQAAIDGAQAELLRSTTEYERQIEMMKRNATSASDVDKWRAQRDSAKAGLDEAKANFDLAEIQYSYTHIYAPFDGRMDRSFVDLRNLVGSGEATKLSVIRKMDPMYAYFTISEKDLARVRAIRQHLQEDGQDIKGKPIPIQLMAEGDEDYVTHGTLDYGSTSIDKSTGSLQLRGTFENPMLALGPKLLPGAYVRLRVPIQEIKDAILLPERLLGINQDIRFVYVVNDQNIAEQRTVQLGTLDGDMRVITSGITKDDWIVTTGVQRVRNGMQLEVERKGQ